MAPCPRLPLLATLIFLISISAHAESTRHVLAESRANKEAFIESFRQTGKRNLGQLAATDTMLRKALQNPDAATIAPELLFELGSVIRLAGRFTDAIPVL